MICGTIYKVNNVPRREPMSCAVPHRVMDPAERVSVIQPFKTTKRFRSALDLCAVSLCAEE